MPKPPEQEEISDASSRSLRRFPATIDFVHLRSVEFDAHRLPPRVTGDENGSFVPDTWDMKISVQEAGDCRYMVEVEAEALFNAEEKGAGEGKSGSGNEDQDVPPPYELSLSAIAGVRTDENLPDEVVDQWLNEGSQYLLIPYLRSFISNVVRNSGFEVPYFPLLAVPVLYQDEERGEIPDESEGQ
jgi:hypothetical protein